MTIQDGLALVADIGGTNARFALCKHDQLLPETIQVLPCANYENLDGAVAAYLEAQSVAVDEACMAFACPVNTGRINMTNNHWDFECGEMKKTLGLKTFKIINDFTAQALALPALCGSQLVKIGAGNAIDDAAKLIIGPGTGLGIAGLKSIMNHWLPLAGEGGHAAYSPVSRIDVEVLAELQKEEPYISWENVLCGSGLETLFRAHGRIAGDTRSLKDYEITGKALKGDALCKQVLNHFCELLGRAAGNAALTMGAQGGVYIAGGIIPRFPEFFAESGFRKAFESNFKMVDYLKAIPTWLVCSNNPGLIGSCEALHNPLV